MNAPCARPGCPALAGPNSPYCPVDEPEATRLRKAQLEQDLYRATANARAQCERFLTVETVSNARRLATALRAYEQAVLAMEAT